ncbi:MAG: CBS domain-containing protein [Desulfomonile tiedjei]|uniref:CBS domain-containing protein n=1 Tax=Desulfomonile tiedjei TaxID=2358 RepID=A0A9D6V6Z6_9BACT|nr:CBS domain-containing protein [Desulfomonile tiedjei]
MKDKEVKACLPLEISDDDVYQAMKEIPGYIDITAADFKEIYLKAYQQAIFRLTHAMKAREIMTANVVAVAEDTRLIDVARMMASARIAGVPVLDREGKPVGVISEKDFLSVMGGTGIKTFMGVIFTCLTCEDCLARAIREKCARDIMTSPAITVSLETSAGELASTMIGKRVNRLPVVDSDGRLVGIISRADILQTSILREEL